jgi:alkanesulfonate monooxygenase SsuD/methylene tetrahydromethanopterin reductase-like flavin-dependent oxidoreductase (luciferase family)
MKLGVQLNSFDWEEGQERFATRLAEIAPASEEAGFDRIAVADHVWQHPIMGGPEANEPECYAMLAFLAANTERVGLGDGVGGPLPPPGDAGEGGDHARRALRRSRQIWG